VPGHFLFAFCQNIRFHGSFYISLPACLQDKLDPA
jgi:hypothetical protein